MRTNVAPVIKGLLVAIAIVAVVGCSGQPLSTREKGTFIGTGLGAATGAIIGAAVGAPGAGAAIGGGVGALGGYAVGNEMQNRENANAQTQAQIQSQQKQLESQQQQIQQLKSQQRNRIAGGEGICADMQLRRVHSPLPRFFLWRDAPGSRCPRGRKALSAERVSARPPARSLAPRSAHRGRRGNRRRAGRRHRIRGR